MSPLPTTGNVTRPKALGYGARLDDLYLRLAVGPGRSLQIETAPLQAERVNTTENPEDVRNEFGQLFSRVDFAGGEGLAFAHRRELQASDLARFWDATGIDVALPQAGESPRIALLPATTNIEPSGNTNLALAYDGTAIYMAEGATVRRSADPSAASPTFANDDPHAGEPATTVTGLAAIGDIVYAALGANGIHRRTGAGWAHFGTSAAVKVWGAKGFLLCSTGAVLERINLATGAVAQTLVTLPSGQSWLDVVDAGAAILAAASDGYIYALKSDGSGGLALGGQTRVDAPEVPYALGSGPGGAFVLYATREPTPSGGAIGRLWRADLDGSSYVLSGAVLVRQWGNAATSVDQAPRRIIAAGAACYVGVQEATRSYLWRYDAITAGRSRHLDAGTSGLIVDVVAVVGRLFFTVSGAGMRREASTYEASGYLISPLADFYSAEDKSWAGALIDIAAAPIGSRVELYYTTDPAAITDSSSSSWIRAKNVTGTDASETALRNVDARYLAAMVKLYATSDAVSTPKVRSFAFRAYPGPGDVIVVMPVNVSDQLERPGKRRVRTKSLGGRLYDELKGREGRYAELELLQLGELLRGVVEQVSSPVPTAAKRGSATFVSMVKFRGRRSTTTGDSGSSAALGVGALGVMTLGGVEA